MAAMTLKMINLCFFSSVTVVGAMLDNITIIVIVVVIVISIINIAIIAGRRHQKQQ